MNWPDLETRKAYYRAYRLKNREKINEQARRNRAKHPKPKRQAQQTQRQWLKELKSSTPCADCGQIFSHFVMDMDHLPQFEKSFNIASAVGNVSWARLKEEIAKCDIVCANCHRTRTYERKI